MAERVLLPPDDESEDIVMRLSSDEAAALYTLLSNLSHSEMAAKGLTADQAAAVSRVLHATY